MLEKEALFGSVPLFARGEGTRTTVTQGSLVLEQVSALGNGERSLKLDPQGGLLIRASLDNEGSGLPAILVETVQQQLTTSRRSAGWVIDQIDRTQRLSHVVVAAQLTGSFGMRTRLEHEASPHSMSMGSGYGGRNECSPVHFLQPVSRGPRSDNKQKRLSKTS
jgi:hypothetical protein